MGAWADLLIQIKNSIAGPVPFGGTIFPTSDNFPTMAAQLLKGGFFTLDTLEQLADIPYQNLQLDQEVVVRLYGAHERTRYRLIRLPVVDTRVSEIPGYDILEYWEPVQAAAGGAGEPGPPGDKGWTPILALENDGGTRVVMRLIAWTGGTGLTPSVPPPPYPSSDVYIGPSGFTSKSGATNVKGDKGDPGDVLTVRPEIVFTQGERIKIGVTLSASQQPVMPWKNFPGTNGAGEPPKPPTYVQGNYLTISPTLFTVRNDWSQPRKFRVFGQAQVSNNFNNRSCWSIRLIRNGQTWDANFAYGDFVSKDTSDPGTTTSVLKIPLHEIITLNPGSVAQYNMTMAQIEGGNSYYTDPFWEAWGL